MKTTKDFEEYRREIHQLIPGGGHTYSKGDERFPLNAPPAIVRGQGSYIWGIDGVCYLDCSMGLGSVSLGHAYGPVIERIKDELLKGSNFQRPSVLEREMAKEFLSLIPCHDMIKFAKNGSTATTAAVKLSRAFTGKNLIAFPEDQAFFSYDDWFIGKKPCSKGVPTAITELSLTYNGRDMKSLETLFQKYPKEIACVISEPEQSTPYPENYLRDLIKLCHENGAIFIQDEMVTGFKTNFPGSITKFNVEPDLATWGKGIANGFSFCALTGKREIMNMGGIIQEGQERVFLISSTHGAETHALAAGLATIKEFREKNVLKHNHQTGTIIINETRKLCQTKDLGQFIKITDSPWSVAFSFKNKDHQICLGMQSLFMQEMISRKVLFQGLFVPSFSHGTKEIEIFLKAFEESLNTYQKAIETSYKDFLIGRPIKKVFRKFN